MAKLTANFVQRALSGQVDPGRYRDQDGLILNVTPGGASWMLRFSMDGRRRDLGLGPAKHVPLTKARELAAGHMRDVKGARIDPVAERKAARVERAGGVPFKTFATEWVASRITAIDRKRGVQWQGTLERYVFPVIGSTSVADVTRAQVLKILEPIWATKHETARRVRQRIERILDVAIAKGLRTEPNPARSKDLKAALDMPRPPTVHHAAMPWRDVPKFYRDLCKHPGNGALALRFAILTAARSNETLGCLWAEIDVKQKTWVVPPNRMKMRKEHRVPLSAQALALLADIPRDGEFVFAGSKKGKPLSNMAMQMAMRRMKRDDFTPHGFRSSFRDWCAENGHSSELAEQALAHRPTGVEGAYYRSDLFAQRRDLMRAWARFVCGR